MAFSALFFLSIGQGKCSNRRGAQAPQITISNGVTMKRKPIAVLISSMAAASLTSVVFAAGPQQSGVVSGGQVVEVKKVLVNATRMTQDIDDVTRPVAVVEKAAIETMQPESIAQVLSYQPNISVAGGPRPNNQTVNIRGLSGNKVLQAIDGVRQVFESGHRPSYFLDPALLQNIEVIKGPASTLWGSGALGGVVAQNTVSAGDLLAPDQSLGGFVKSSYNDNNHQLSSTLALAGRAGSVDWLLSTYYRDGDDIELGNGDNLEGSASRDQGALAKVEWQIDDAQSFAFNLRQAEDNGSVPSNGGADFNGTSNYLISRESKTQNFSLDYRVDTDSPLINSQVMAYWNQIEMNESRVSDGRSDTTELDVLGININNVSTLGDIAVLYGIDGYQESFDTERGGSNRPAPPKAETDVWGGFVQATIPFASTWSLELGGRYDYFATEATNLNQDRSDNDVSPSAALTWQSTDWLSMTLRHDRAFRAPSSEELYSSGSHFCMGPGFCNTFLPNPDLNPEQAANTEFLVSMQFNDLGGGDSLSINASVFENNVDDFIEQIVSGPSFFPVPNAGNTTWVNVDKAEISGYELAADYQRGALRIKLAYGQSRGEDKKTGDDLTDIPANTLTADLSYGFMQRQLTAGVRLISADDQNRTDYSENTAGTRYEDYNVVDLYAHWQPATFKALSVDLTVNNVSDKHYRRAWSELDESGREVIIAAKYSF